MALHDRRLEAEAAEALGEVHPRQAAVVLRAAERRRRRSCCGSCAASRSSIKRVDAGEVVVGHGLSVTSRRARACWRSIQPDLFYARQQMAFSLGAHIVHRLHRAWRSRSSSCSPSGEGQRTGDLVYTTLARRWAKAMGVLFAVGAVSGTILSFEFGILWPRWMGRFGDVMGLPFAIEGFAFFLEAIFIGIYLYGWDRLPPRVHLRVGIADRHRGRRVGVLRRRRERLDERPDRVPRSTRAATSST